MRSERSQIVKSGLLETNYPRRWGWWRYMAAAAAEARGDARRRQWYRHGQCTRYVAGESHVANSYLCAQKSRAGTTLVCS